MQVDKQTILEQLEKYENKNDILDIIDGTKDGDFGEMDIDVLDQFISNIKQGEIKYNVINFNLEQYSTISDNTYIITTYQEIKPEISKTIIWEYDPNIFFESVDDFVQFIADTHNEIDKVFNN